MSLLHPDSADPDPAVPDPAVPDPAVPDSAVPDPAAPDPAADSGPNPELPGPARSILGGQTYETALGRVEEIIRRLDGGGAGLRETLDLVREGRTLIEFCARELEEVGRGLEELRLEELVARLEASPSGLASGREFPQ